MPDWCRTVAKGGSKDGEKHAPSGEPQERKPRVGELGGSKKGGRVVVVRFVNIGGQEAAVVNVGIAPTVALRGRKVVFT